MAALRRRSFLKWAGLGASALLAPTLRRRAGGAEPATLPIKRVVVILRENHSYDNYFGTFPQGNGQTAGGRCEDERPDPPHLREHALRGSYVDIRGYCHYREADIPNYWAYAREFVLSDNYFADVLGPSYPNYFMLMAAQTPTLDHIRGQTRGKYDLPAITDRLTEKGVTWRNYDGGLPLVSMFKNAVASGNVVPLRTFAEDAAEGRVPSVSWLTPALADSEHPPASVRRGENWTVGQVNALMRSRVWPECAIVIVWDEWGGFWDHVKPPVVEKEKGFFGQVIRYGYRIPCLVISPYARTGFIDHQTLSFDAYVKFIEDDFLGGARLDPRTDGRPDPRPSVRETAPQLGSLLADFDFSQAPRGPELLATHPAPGPASR